MGTKNGTPTPSASVIRTEFVDALKIVSSATTTRSTLPVLGNILLVASEGSLSLVATNLEVAVTRTIPAVLEHGGFTITLPARVLTDWAGCQIGDRISIAFLSKTASVTLTCERQKSTIKGIDANEFPIVPTAVREKTVLVNAGVFRVALARVATCALTDESRPTMHGVSLEIGDRKCVCVAADGFRLARCDVDVTGDATARAIMPLTSVKSMLTALAQSDGNVAVGVSDKNISVSHSAEDWSVVSSVVDGEFVRYAGIIPTDYSNRIVCNTSDLVGAVKASAPFARESNQRITVSPGNAVCAISAQSAFSGDCCGVIEATVNGTPHMTVLNSRYLTDALSGITTPKVVLEARESTDPVLIRPDGDERTIFVIMPMTIG